MNKVIQKNKKYTYDQRIIEALVVKYGLTKVYIRMCLRGGYTTITADKIKADYKQLEKEMKQTLEKFNAKN